MAAAFRLALEGRAFPPQRRGQQQAGQRSNGRISAEQSSDVVETDAEAAREEEAPEPNADAANCGLPDPMHAQTSADALKGVLKSIHQADSSSRAQGNQDAERRSKRERLCHGNSCAQRNRENGPCAMIIISIPSTSAVPWRSVPASRN